MKRLLHVRGVIVRHSLFSLVVVAAFSLTLFLLYTQQAQSNGSPDCNQSNILCVGPGEEYATQSAAYPNVEEAFHAAANAAVPGDTIYIRGGHYVQDFNNKTFSTFMKISVSGSATDPIAILPYPGESVHIQGFAPEPSTNHGTLMEIEGDYIHVQGIEFSHGNRNCVEIDGSHVEVDHNVIHDCQGSGIHLGRDSVSMDDNNVHHNEVYASTDAAIRVRPNNGAVLSNQVIENNFLYQNNAGIDFFVSCHPGTGLGNNCPNSVTRRNIAWGNSAGIVPNAAGGSRYIDNISFGNSHIGFVNSRYAEDGSLLFGNITFDNVTTGVQIRNDGPVRIENNSTLQALWSALHNGNTTDSLRQNNLVKELPWGNTFTNGGGASINNWRLDVEGSSVVQNESVTAANITTTFPTGTSIEDKLQTIRHEVETALEPTAASPLVDAGIFDANIHCATADDDSTNPHDPNDSDCHHWLGNAPDIGAVERGIVTAAPSGNGDTTPPVVTITSPADGALVNNEALTVTGSSDEAVSSVSVNGQAASVDAQNQFTASITLQEGSNTITVIATDLASNQGQAQITVFLDSTAPFEPNISTIYVSAPDNGLVTVMGPSSSVEANAMVTVTNTRTNESTSVTADSDGGFTLNLGGLSGDVYTIVVTDQAGNTSTSAQITESTLPPDPEMMATPIDTTEITPFKETTEFLYAGANPIQTGVNPLDIEEKRAGIIRGKVLAADASPLPGVTITINGHPEFGQTLSRADGIFDMVVNGGSTLVVNYSLDGYLPVQRQVQVPWNEFASPDDIVMIQLDSQVSVIDLNSSSAMQAAQGSMITDTDGSRQATVLFPQGTTATMVMPDGSEQPISTLNVRATEYTVGTMGRERMPGELPPTSGYTYAVELSVDEAINAGATQITFNQPIPTYVDNFLGFPTGEPVPAGFYDAETSAWVPSKNGRVIEILSIDTNNMAELDVDGSGQIANATQLAELNISEDERTQLASLYTSGKSIWRVEIPHFTPWDFNWPYGPPPDAEPPLEEAPETDDKPEEEDPCDGCIIDAQSQTLGETIPVVATPYTLNYKSDRQQGRTSNRKISIPISGDSVPPSLQRIELAVVIAGQSVKQTFPPNPNLTYEFNWDGKDIYGRDMSGIHQANINIDYVYLATYYKTETTFSDSFALPTSSGPGPSASIGPARESNLIFINRNWAVPLKGINTLIESGSIGGWAINVHHSYELDQQQIHQGDGDTRNVVEECGTYACGVVSTVAGNASAISGAITTGGGFSGDGGLATQAELNFPRFVEFGLDGSIFIWDQQNWRIRRISTNGIISTYAGSTSLPSSSVPPNSGDGGLAVDAELSRVSAIAVGNDGSVYTLHSRLSSASGSTSGGIRRIKPDGIIDGIAGSGDAGFSGDGGLATNAAFNRPSGLAIAPDGTLYVSDTNNHRIRRISPSGIVTTVAGTGVAGYSADGTLAAQALVNAPTDITVANDGSIYFVTGASNINTKLIRRISPDGIISTEVGNPNKSSLINDSAEGAFATEIAVKPNRIRFSAEGTLYFMEVVDEFDSNNARREFSRIRRVRSDGIVHTIAGLPTGISSATSPDGNLGIRTYIVEGEDFALGSDNNLYFLEGFFGHKLRQVRLRNANVLASTNEIGIPSESGNELYVFDLGGKHLRTMDTVTGAQIYTFVYNATGQLVSITDVDGDITTIERDAAGAPLSITSPDQQRTDLALNANGYLSTVTNPNNEAYQFVYTAGGLLKEATNPRQNTNIFNYDANGRLISDTDPVGGGWTISRTGSSDQYTVTMTTGESRDYLFTVENLFDGGSIQTNLSPAGTTTVKTYNADGSELITTPEGMQLEMIEGPDPRFGMMSPVIEEVNISTPLGITNSITRGRSVTLSDPADLFSHTSLTETIDSNGRISTISYDTATSTWTTTTPENRQSSRQLNTDGRTTELAFSGLSPIQLAYNVAGRISQISDGTGVDQRTTSHSYYVAGAQKGLLQSTTDAEGRIVSFEYDNAGRVITQTLPGNLVTQFDYDANGNLRTLTTPLGDIHSFDYTGVDLESDYTPPSLASIINVVTQSIYNKDKQLELVTLPTGETIDPVYNPTTAQLTSLQIPRGNYSYTYTSTTGQLDTITAPDTGILDLDFDGDLLLASTWSGDVSGNVSQTYDNNFVVKTVTVSGSDTISYDYDDDLLLKQAGALTILRDPITGLEDTTTLGQISTQQAFNEFGEVDSYDASYDTASLYNVSYVRDKLGRIKNKTETIQGVTNNIVYTYDAAGRLDSASVNGATTSYDYDDNGNRELKIIGATLTNGAYDQQDRLVSYGDFDYAYTDDGALLTKTNTFNNEVTTYNYDVLGNLISVDLPNTTAIEYVVDGLDRRIGKKVDGVLVQGFLYQDELNPVAELDGNGNIVSRFVYADKVNVPEYMIKGGVTYRMISDHIGSPRLIINTSDGSVAQRIDYDEFGNIISDTNPGFQPFGFAGGLYDQDTKLVRFGVRDYDPEVGRWTTKDPIRFDGGVNLYAYTVGDPINFYDPLGQFRVALGVKGSFFFGGAGGNLGVNIGFDTTGNVCATVQTCGLLGVGASVGAGITATVGSNFNPCRGNALGGGVFGNAGLGPFGSFSSNTDGKTGSTTVTGTLGGGAGVSAGAQGCVSRSFCL